MHLAGFFVSAKADLVRTGTSFLKQAMCLRIDSISIALLLLVFHLLRGLSIALIWDNEKKHYQASYSLCEEAFHSKIAAENFYEFAGFVSTLYFCLEY